MAAYEDYFQTVRVRSETTVCLVRFIHMLYNVAVKTNLYFVVGESRENMISRVSAIKRIHDPGSHGSPGKEELSWRQDLA
jgi:hypothetical protein